MNLGDVLKKKWIGTVVIIVAIVAFFGYQFYTEYEDPEEYYRFAEYLYSQRQMDQALAAVEKCLALQADHGEAMHLKGKILLHTKRKQGINEVVTLYEKLTRTHPDSSKYFTELGGLYVVMARFDDAARQYQKALELNPDDQRAFQGLITLMEKRGVFDQ